MMELSTTDQNAAKAFYTSLLGWTFRDNPMSAVGTYTMFLSNGSEVASAYTQRKDQTEAGIPPHWDLYVSVLSADDCVKKAVELGGKSFCPPFDVLSFGRMAVIEDPTGATICIWEPKVHIGVATKNEPGSLCWADLMTPNPTAASKFYTALFGWTLVPGEGGYLHVKCGDDFIGGIPPAHTAPPGAPRTGWAICRSPAALPSPQRSKNLAEASVSRRCRSAPWAASPSLPIPRARSSHSSKRLSTAGHAAPHC